MVTPKVSVIQNPCQPLNRPGTMQTHLRKNPKFLSSSLSEDQQGGISAGRSENLCPLLLRLSPWKSHVQWAPECPFWACGNGLNDF